MNTAHSHKPNMARKYIVILGSIVLAGGFTIPAHALKLGHSRLLSEPGNPLTINIPITEINQSEADSLQVVAAAESDWKSAGLKPPVPLNSISGSLTEGAIAGTHILRITSNHVFSDPIADLLLDIKTSSGTQRYQVSLIAQSKGHTAQLPSASTNFTQKNQNNISSEQTESLTGQVVQIKKGDTMFSLAKRYVVGNVSIYQMMIALQRANPHAFIHDNLNLIKAGERLNIPSTDAIKSISDSEARKIYHQQMMAFEQIKHGDQQANSSSKPINANLVSQSSETIGDTEKSDSNLPNIADSEDQLRLSSAVEPNGASVSSSEVQPKDSVASGNGIASNAHAASVNSETLVQSDDAVAAQKAIEEAEQRVSQLEENVKKLNHALQSQGEAAKDVVIDGAKGIKDSLTEVASAVAEATGMDDETSKQDAAQSIDAQIDVETAASDAQSNANNSNVPDVAVAENVSVSWIDKYFKEVALSIIGFLLFIIVILLTRAARRADQAKTAVTPEMVQEKLNKINLDLQDPVIGDSSSDKH